MHRTRALRFVANFRRHVVNFHPTRPCHKGGLNYNTIIAVIFTLVALEHYLSILIIYPELTNKQLLFIFYCHVCIYFNACSCNVCCHCLCQSLACVCGGGGNNYLNYLDYLFKFNLIT